MNTTPSHKPGLLESLALGLPVPALFAIYSVYLRSVKPGDTQLENLGAIQAAFFASGLTAILGLITSLRRTGTGKPTFDRARQDWRELLWLNFYTLLGPPLYFVAIVKLGASPANWIDLGMTPILTMGAAIALRKSDRPTGILAWIGMFLALAGIVIVMVNAYLRLSAFGAKSGSIILGVCAAIISAIGTAGAGVYLARLQRDREHPLSPGSLLWLRYTLPTVILGIAWVVEHTRVDVPGIALAEATPRFLMILTLLFVLPNYVYVIVLRKKSLLFSGYMWALLPVFGSVTELAWLGPKEASLGLVATLVAGFLVIAGVVVGDHAEKTAVSASRE